MVRVRETGVKKIASDLRPPGSQDWYWNDWKGSPRVMVLSDVEYRAYHQLIGCCHQLGGVLPKDVAALRRLVPDAPDGVTPLVMSYLDPHPEIDGALTQMKTWAQLKEWRIRKAAGSKGGRASQRLTREAKAEAIAEAQAEANCQRKRNRSPLPAPLSPLPASPLPANVANDVAASAFSSTFEALAYHPPFLLGEPKAHALMDRLGTTIEDVEAWKTSGMPTRKIVWAVQRFKNPSAMAAHEARVDAEDQDPSLRRSDDARREVVLRARARNADPKLRELEDSEAASRALNARTQETLDDLKRAEKVAVPPPPEFFEAYRRLKESK